MKNQSVYQNKWDSENTKRYGLKLNIINDKDIINEIDDSNKQGSLKRLLRDGIKYRKQGK